jgi:hypothetical protein
VRFGGATAVIASSYNVTSITDNGVGTYQVNFTTAMADANYNVLAAHGDTSRGGTATNLSGWTTTDFDMGTSHEATADTTVFVDPTAVEVVVFGDM